MGTLTLQIKLHNTARNLSYAKGECAAMRFIRRFYMRDTSSPHFPVYQDGLYC